MKTPNSNRNNQSIVDRFLSYFNNYDKFISLTLTVIISVIILAALVRVVFYTYNLIVVDFFSPENVDFNDYSQVFAKILTLLIAVEFVQTILKSVKSHNIKALVLDIALIAGLAICRKLIIIDYKEFDPMHLFAFGFLLISLIIFYYLGTVGNGFNKIALKTDDLKNKGDILSGSDSSKD